MISPKVGPFHLQTKTRQVIAHHYDDEKPGKPLYLLIPGGIIALASLALIILIAYRVWIEGTMPQASGLTLIAVLAPVYIGGVFLFSYGYELYNLPRALGLTALIVVITLAAVIIIAVLFLALGAMGDQRSRSSRSSASGASARSSGGRGSGFGGIWPIFLGGWGSPAPPVTREEVHEAPAAPPPPQPIQCPYCGKNYIPAQTNFICPTCGAPTPQDMMLLDQSQGNEGK